MQALPDVLANQLLLHPIPYSSEPSGKWYTCERVHSHVYRHTSTLTNTHPHSCPSSALTSIQPSIRSRKQSPGLYKGNPGLSLEVEWFYGRGNFEQPAKQDKGLIWFIKPGLHPLFSQPRSVNQYPDLWIEFLLNKSAKIFLLYQDTISSRKIESLRC